MKKKSTALLLGIVVMSLSILVGCQTEDQTENGETNGPSEDALAFVLEHEELNGVAPNPDYPDIVFQEIFVAENNPFRYVEFDEIAELLESGTGIVYFGFPTCPWCRNLVPALTDAAIEFGVEDILYRNVFEDRNILELGDDGEIVEIRAGHPGYYEVLEILGNLAPAYTGLEDDSIRRVFVPAVVFVRDGEIISYFTNLPTFQARVDDENDETTPWDFMNDDEVEELTQIFLSYFEQVFGE
ncbi:MAG: glutaredoxin [Turicibacter sp.]|nr:glutaredoxin [Turicibacter sp.]